MDQLEFPGFFRPELPFTPNYLDLSPNLLSRIDPRYLIQEKHLNSKSEDWFNSSTTIPDRTCLYAGASSDQGPHLLRHLSSDERGCFGDNKWLIWRVSQRESTHLTVYPNHLLDCHTAMYDQERIEALFAPYQHELIDLYFKHIHPSYPILGSKRSFCKSRAEGTMPASLLAVVLIHGSYFWHLSSQSEMPLPDRGALQPYVFSCLTFETRTPNVAVIQATLLFMQLPARFTRAPNHPGVWSVSTMLMGMVQDMGLHIEPSAWNITSDECKLRRVLWWAVFVHDKSMAHWLGRPSHIKNNDWNVEPLNLKDFTDDDGRLDVDCISWANSFIALASLSLVMADLLDDFYGVRSNFQTMEGAVAEEKGRFLLGRLHSWREVHTISRGLVTDAHHFTVQFAAITVELSIQRAVLGAKRPVGYQNDFIPHEILDTISLSLFPLLDSLTHSALLTPSLWLNYSKGNLSMIGSLLISLILSSIDDGALNDRRSALLDFRSRLQILAIQHSSSHNLEFALLPLRRLNLIIEEIFGQRSSTPRTVTLGVDESEDNLWASYRIAFPWED
ncbi:hypothetical protein P154DRAFT_233612 [Amniculicola lignicola CBS 123094]|uniref:Xylanolytic transcriptional activator regulatory domain-containing protein n=1 Tax=Amniculicola lignicola CBS 123094 TaxID=1392246 RepID=A0A6A5WCB7_9PLEO|nr:hypothetical protein P154DRAFT_233612 [Amniculicola lignicola CBS 123094]